MCDDSDPESYQSWALLEDHSCQELAAEADYLALWLDCDKEAARISGVLGENLRKPKLCESSFRPVHGVSAFANSHRR